MKQYELANFEQEAGKSAQPLTYWHDAKTIDLTQDQAKLLFRQYPNLKKRYATEVPHKKSEEDFWQ